MKTKTISLAVLSLGLCTLAFAAEYKEPTVEFKRTSPSFKETKVAEFNDEYKVEGAVKTDRGIASEKEDQREPSSVMADDKKKMEEMPSYDDKEETFTPKPWLYRQEAGKSF